MATTAALELDHLRHRHPLILALLDHHYSNSDFIDSHTKTPQIFTGYLQAAQREWRIHLVWAPDKDYRDQASLMLINPVQTAPSKNTLNTNTSITTTTTINAPNTTTTTTLYVEKALHTLLVPHAEQLYRRATKLGARTSSGGAGAASDLLDDIQAIIEANADRIPTLHTRHAIGVDKVLADIQNLDGVVNVNTNGRACTLERGGHQIHLNFAENYPKEPPVITADLPVHPEDIEAEWWKTAHQENGKENGQTHHYNHLQKIVAKYEKLIHELEDYFTVIQDWHEKAWVLEPENFIYGQRTMRVAIAKGMSVQIDTDPFAPRTRPRMRFLGNDEQRKSYTQAVRSTHDQWDPSLFPRENLQQILGITLPQKETAENDGGAQNWECQICYLLKVDDELPSVVCNNPKCAKSYHASCLGDWLRSLTTTRASSDAIYGSCLMCEQPICVPLKT